MQIHRYIYEYCLTFCLRNSQTNSQLTLLLKTVESNRLAEIFYPLFYAHFV